MAQVEATQERGCARRAPARDSVRLHKGAAEMAVIRARIGLLAGAAVTRYDALARSCGGQADEKTLQSRRQAG
jgi:hypothetical protein